MDLKQLMIAPLLRMRVVHSLPGRIRIHLPLLGKVPKSQQQLVQLAEQVVCSMDGIHTARACTATSNLLLTYDVNLWDEGRIVDSLEQIMGTLASHASALASLSADQLAQHRAELEAAVESTGSPRELEEAVADVLG